MPHFALWASFGALLFLGSPLRSSTRSEEWWLEMDLNHRPGAYETPALTTELSSRTHSFFAPRR